MTPEESKRFGAMESNVERLLELEPLIREMHGKMQHQAGFVTGVAVTVSALWALLLAAVAYFWPPK